MTPEPTRPSEPSVRPATLDDVEFLSQTVYATYLQDEPTMTPAEKDSWLDGYRSGTRDQALGLVENSTTYVICVGEERAGRLRVVRTPERVFLGGIQIHPAFQNRGIGTAVITTLLDEASGKGVAVELQVNKDNGNAERLYVRLGFRRNGELGEDYLMTTG
ncbi:GNAT family N-acetyltransferase [Actinopolymorpha rutila]|uniref:Ribosomal protein S18 acetylase RimI-like enzyme n=1 Tax=Actinopolymorpha rutila TaxID=446787 RepID=A0A852ZFL1_9ACTN|nr:GNAT family N-acetyltransferase [Actinopolymorpha rutila]NYH87760.1 ribosomal protein S18 acetylase RimI-like enzyme [Actinopolymorpha rutila]